MLYPLAEAYRYAMRHSLPAGVERRDFAYWKGGKRVKLMAKKTGETRPPHKGEWFISGAEPEAYYAPDLLAYEYPIAVLVPVRSRTIIEEV